MNNKGACLSTATKECEVEKLMVSHIKKDWNKFSPNRLQKRAEIVSQ